MSAANVWTRLRHVLGDYPTTAEEWSARARSEDVTRAELLALDEWLRADPRNAEAYARASKVAHLGSMLRDVPAARSRLRRMSSPPTDGRRSLIARPGLQFATAVSIALVIALTSYVLIGPAPERYVSGRGEQRQVGLSDGSRMIVNTDSAATVRFTQTERLVQLANGEAFFEVAKDKARPFVVRTPGAEVRAVGTKFSVRYDGSATHVVVSEGRVKTTLLKASDDLHAAELGVNRQAVVAVDRPLVVAQTDAALATAWTNGNVAFEDAPLAEVIADVNRYTRKPFVIADPSLTQVRLTGRFRVGDVESVKFVLAGRFDIRVVEEEFAIRLSR